MGKRGKVLIKWEDNWVSLYTHWGASELLYDIKRGLKQLFTDWGERDLDRGDRQAAYIFAEMIKTNKKSTTIEPYGSFTIEELHKYIKKYDWYPDILVIINGNDISLLSEDNNFVGTTIERFMNNFMDELKRMKYLKM